jgi:hypothetical protein
MSFFMRVLPFACLMLFVLGCRKETIAPITTHPTHRDLMQVKALTGLLADEPVTLISNEPYSEVTFELAGNNPNGNVKQSSKTGSRWTDIDPQGIIMTTGSIEIQNEIFRIYVTPFLSGNGNGYGLYHMLANGNRNFSGNNGVRISVRDAQGVLWTSDGNQSGSTFEITSRSVNMQTYATVTGTLSCKMYDGAGHVKQFTQGLFTGDFGL